MLRMSDLETRQPQPLVASRLTDLCHCDDRLSTRFDTRRNFCLRHVVSGSGPDMQSHAGIHASYTPAQAPKQGRHAPPLNVLLAPVLLVGRGHAEVATMLLF